MPDTRGLSTFRVIHECPEIHYISHIWQYDDILQNLDHPLIIGGGSNILFTGSISRPVVVINHTGIRIISDQADHIIVEVEAGTIWDDFVSWAVARDYGGVENLSLIPGKCGAAPIQNIGAYGVELKDVFVSLDAFELNSGHIINFDREACQFDYRYSIFKDAFREKVIIQRIRLRLSKSGHHKYETSYGTIMELLDEWQVLRPTIKDISRAVISIRRSKLPDPSYLPNAGSFFKNPIISNYQFQYLKKDFPQMPHYPIGADLVKVPAGWLIDHAGWRGKSIGFVGTHEHQALVIVNKGTQNGQDILDFANRLQSEVFSKFGIEIEPEVNIY